MKKSILYVLLGTLAILSIPLLARAPWTVGDYVVAGLLLLVTGFAISFAVNKLHNKKKKVFAVALVLALALYVWAELAVGIFTDLGS